MDSQAATAAIAAARLLSLRLTKRQPLLLTFFIATAVGNIGLGFLPLKSDAYFWAYLICQSISDLLAIGVVRELFSTISIDYPGIQTAARWVLNGAIAVSALASLIVYLPMRGTDTPTPTEVARVAGNGPFQSMSCLAGCARSPRFCSIGWDKSVAWCSYTVSRTPLPELTYRGLEATLPGLGLTFCGGT